MLTGVITSGQANIFVCLPHPQTPHTQLIKTPPWGDVASIPNNLSALDLSTHKFAGWGDDGKELLSPKPQGLLPLDVEGGVGDPGVAGGDMSVAIRERGELCGEHGREGSDDEGQTS